MAELEEGILVVMARVLRHAFSLLVREFIDGSPSPLDGFQRFHVLDRVAAGEHVVDRHHADDPRRDNFRLDDGRDDRIIVKECRLQAPSGNDEKDTRWFD